MLHEWRVKREGVRKGKGIIYRQAKRDVGERHKEVKKRLKRKTKRKRSTLGL